MVQLILYTTSGCHLCEEAEIMLKRLDQQGVCQWQAVEISEEEHLIDRYGVRIPVVSNGAGEEIGWPFDPEHLEDWLKTRVLG